MIYVTKANGERKPFNPNKVLRTCKRLGLNDKEANEILKYIQANIYDGIRTSKILKMIFSKAKEFREKFKHSIDLREAISLLRPKPDFEHFVGYLMKSLGYEIISNQIVPGKCVEHEVDIIAKKGKEVIHVEVKHHYNFHTYTGLEQVLATYSAFKDMKDGYEEGFHNFNFSSCMIICNTKFSFHAKKFAKCKGIKLIGWRTEKISLENLIEKNKLYPITMIKGISQKEIEKFGNANIVLIKQLVEMDPKEIYKLTKIPKDRINSLKRRGRIILEH